MSYTYEKVFVSSDYPAVTAEQANHYFNEENPAFTLATVFKCGPNCNAEISCANYTIDFSNFKNKNKRRPYFVNRKQQSHSSICNHWDDVAQSRIGYHEKNSYYTQKNNEYIIEFLPNKGLLPTRNHGHTKVSDAYGKLSTSSKSSRGSSLQPQHRTPHKSDLKSIVNLFEEHNAGNKYIQIYDKNKVAIKFSDIFEKIDRKNNPTLLSNSPKIYYGQAKAILKDNDSIQVQFTGTVSLNELSDKYLSFVLYKDTCEENDFGPLYRKFKKLADAFTDDPLNFSSYFTLYYDGTFLTKDNKYINFNQTPQKMILSHIVITPN